MGRKTRSASEAHALHEIFRSYLLEVGRYVAVQLAQQHGEVHVGMVAAEMLRRGFYERVPVEAIRGPARRFHGTLFLKPAGLPRIWEKTGTRAPRVDASRNTHGGDSVTVWRLVEGADLTPYATMPPVPVDVPVAPPEPVAAVAREVVAGPFDRRAAAEELRRFGEVHVYSENTLALLAWLEG